MLKKNKNTLILALILLFSVTFCITLSFLETVQLQEAPYYETQYTYSYYDSETNTTKEELLIANTIKVNDLFKPKRISSYNYQPNEYLSVHVPRISNEHNNEPFASKGTLIYVITNIDGITPGQSSWEEGLKPYTPYIDVDDRIHLTMYLPPMLSACNVFVRLKTVETLGTLTGFETADYIYTDPEIEYDEKVIHTDGTKGTFLDVTLNVSKRTWNDDPISNGCVITIHYEAQDGKRAGFIGTPIIGLGDDVKQIVYQNNIIRYFTEFLALGTFFILIFVCCLKKAIYFIPQLIFAYAIFVGTCASTLFTGETATPYLWLGFRNVSFNICLLACSLTLPNRFKKIPIKFIFISLSVLTIVLAFIIPQINLEAAFILQIIQKVFSSLLIVGILCFTFIELYKGKPLSLSINNILACGMGIYVIFFYCEKINLLLNPLQWISLFILSVTLVVGFQEFIESERKNRYLTANLATEVQHQTENMQKLIHEREQILQFLSHDMRKPLRTAQNHLASLRKKENDEEHLKMIQIIEDKLLDVHHNLSEVSEYTKINYVAEQTTNIEMNSFLDSIYQDIAPDAEANGILLKISTTKVQAYAKSNALKSVLCNLIWNAIEHSGCSEINVHASKLKDKCIITVSDNGKGLGNKNVFHPYVSDNDQTDNVGLGLFMCQSHIEEMNGTLEYEYENHILTFTITLPLA